MQQLVSMIIYYSDLLLKKYSLPRCVITELGWIKLASVPMVIVIMYAEYAVYSIIDFFDYFFFLFLYCVH